MGNMHLNKNKSRKFTVSSALLLTFHILILIIYYIIFSSNISLNSFVTENDMLTQSWISVSFIALAAFSWITLTKTVFSPYLFFLASFYFFQSGQAFLYAFNVEKSYLDVLSYSQMYEIIKAQFFTNMCILTFSIGAILAFIRKRKKISIKLIKIDSEYKLEIMHVMNIIGEILLMITVIPTFYFLIRGAITSANIGYADMRDLNDMIFGGSIFQRSLLSFSNSFFVPSLFLLIYANKDNYLKRKIFVVFVATYSFLLLINGGRTFAVTSILTLLWFWNTFVRKYSNTQKVFVACFSLLFFMVMPVIAAFRGSMGKDVSLFFTIFADQFANNNLLISFIAGLGYSVYPLILVQKYIPLVRPFAMGQTFIFSLFSIIPKSFLFGFGDMIAKATDIAGWLSFDMLQQRSGVGSSMSAELYYNFGWYGVFGMIFWGMLIGSIFYFSIDDKQKVFSNPLWGFFVTCFMYFNLTLPRQQFATSVRNMVYISAICFIIQSISKNSSRRGAR